MPAGGNKTSDIDWSAIPETAGSSIDTKKLSKDIGHIESGNDYGARNNSSSAAGKYQFLWSEHGDDIKKVTGVKTKDEFINNPSAQEKFFQYHIENNIKPGIEKLRKLNTQGYSDSQLAKLIHFKGQDGAEEFLTTGKDGTQAHNIPIPEYVGEPENKINWDNIPDDSQKKSPVESAPGSAAPSPSGPPLSSQSSVAPKSWEVPSASINDPQPGAGVAQGVSGGNPINQPLPEAQVMHKEDPVNPIDKAAASSKVLIDDISSNLRNLPASYSDNIQNAPMGAPGGVIHDITDPHGDPAMTGGYLKTRLAQLEIERAQKMKEAVDAFQNNPSGVAPEGINAEYFRREKELRDAADHTMELQLANQAAKNNDFDAVKIGVQKQIAMGDKSAEKDMANLNIGKPINPDAKAHYQAIGLSALQTGKQAAAANDQQGIAEVIGSHSDDPEQRLEKDNPEYYKKVRAQALGNQIYQDENPIFGLAFSHSGVAGITQDDIDAAAKKLGFTKKQIEGIRPEDIPSSAGLLNQAGQGFINTVGAPLYEGSMRALAGLGVANKDAVDQRFHTGWETEGGFGAALTGKMPQAQSDVSVHNIRGVVGAMAKGVGDLGGFLVGGEAGGSLLKGAGVVSDVDKANKVANFATAALPAYNSAYANSEKLIGDDPKDEWKRKTYSIINGVLSGAVMQLDPQADVARDILGETKAGKSIINILKKGGVDGMTKESLRPILAQVASETGKHLGLQIAIPVANKIGKNMTNMLFDPKGGHDLSDNVGGAAVGGAIGMFLPSLLAGIHHPANQTPLNKSIIWDIGTNSREYENTVRDLYRQGKMTSDEFHTAYDGIQKASAIIKTQIPDDATISNKRLTPDQQKDYAWNLLRSQYLHTKIEGIERSAKPDKSQVKLLQEQVSELEGERTDILKKAGEVPVGEMRPTLKITTEPSLAESGSHNMLNIDQTDERSVATDAQSEEGNSAQKKSEPEEKNNIPLTPQGDNVNEKPTENEISIRNVQEQDGASTEGSRKEPAQAEKADDGKDGHEQQEAGLLKPASEKDIEAAPQERPLPVKGKRFSSMKIPIEENAGLKTQDLGEVKGEPEAETKQAVKEATIKHPDKPADILASDHPTGETFNAAKDRFKSAVDEIAKDAPDNSVIPTHSWGIKLIQAADKVGWDSPDLAKEHQKGSTETGEILPYKTEDGRILWFARHGETEDNTNGLQRTDDTPLTEKGREQAKKIADQLKEKGITPSKIITSDLPRAKETSEIIRNEFAKPEKGVTPASGEHPELAAINKEFEDKKAAIISEHKTKVAGLEQKVAEKAANTKEIQLKKENYQKVTSLIDKLGERKYGEIDLNSGDKNDGNDLAMAMAEMGIYGGDKEKIQDNLLNKTKNEIRATVDDSYNSNPEQAKIKIAERERDDKIRKAKNKRDYDYSEKQKELAEKQKTETNASAPGEKQQPEVSAGSSKPEHEGATEEPVDQDKQDVVDFLATKGMTYDDLVKLRDSKKAKERKKWEKLNEEWASVKESKKATTEATNHPATITPSTEGTKEKVEHFLGLDEQGRKDYLSTLENEWIPESEKAAASAEYEGVRDTHQHVVDYLKDKLRPAIDEALAQEKLNQAPNDERSFATKPQSENQPSAPKELTREEKHQAELKRIDEDLLHQKASQQLEFKKGREAEKKGDIDAINKHKDNWHKKQSNIEKLQDERERIVDANSKERYEEETKESYKGTADKIRAFRKKILPDDSMLQGSPLPISPKLVGKFIDKVADFVEQLGNFHVAIHKAIEWYKAQGEKPPTEEERKDIEASLWHLRTPPTGEPASSRYFNETHKPWADAAIEDMEDPNDGADYDHVVDTVMNYKGLHEETKAKILNYIDWKTKDKFASGNKEVESFETSKGSKYQYGPDGKTKRIKTATGEEYDPQDLTVFSKFKDADQEQRFLRGVQDPTSGTKVYVIDKDAKVYDKNEEVKGKDVRLALVDPNTGAVLETADTKTDPTKGYQTFDQRRYDKEGQSFRESHIGNEVVKVNYKNKNAQPKADEPATEQKPVTPAPELFTDKSTDLEKAARDEAPPMPKEPVLSIDHEEYAKDILADIFRGKITPEEATQNVMYDNYTDKERNKIVAYLKWHIENDITSIKNATTRLRREQFGLNEEIPAAKKEFGKTWDEAKRKIEDNPQKAQELIQELTQKARPLTDVENAILLHHQNTKEIEFQKLNDKINKAADDGDQAAILEYKTTKARLLDELQELYDVNKAVGTENARGLASRRMMVDRKYSLVNMISEKRATANEGKPLSEQQTEEIEQLHKKITETQAAFDDYVKNADSQIIDLQRKALAGPVKSKNKVSAKLREWADKMDKANKNTAYSSPIPIPPQMITGAMRLIADGIDKGEAIVDLVKKAVGKLSKDNPGMDEHALEKEINKSLIDSGFLDVSPERRKATEAWDVFANGKLDREALRLKVLADRAKAQHDINLKRDQEKQLSRTVKAQNLFIKWQRAFKLSNPLTMGKLVMAGLTRLTTTPIEDAIGGVYSAILPKLAKGAIGEGGGLNVKETARAYKEGLMLGIRDSKEIMSKGTQGKSELDVLFGKAGELPPEMMDFFGQLHSATKAPIKRIAFERSLGKRLRRNAANGVDISDPMVQTSIMVDAYKDANRAIFMQDNKVAQGWQNAVKHFNKVDPKTGKAPSRAIGTAMQWLVPFVKVPTNIAAEVGTHVYGAPVAAVKILHAAFTAGIENIPADQKEIIMRQLKKGTMGLALMSLGYFNPQNFGGFYQHDDEKKRKKGDADAMGLKLFGVKIPAWFAESPAFQAIQVGATVRRIKDQKVKGVEKGIEEGMWAATMGMAEDVPMVSQPLRIGKLFENKKERDYYFGEVAKSLFVPAISSYVAKATDPADKGTVIRKMLAPEEHRRAPKTIAEHIKSGLPYFREQLPIKKAK